MCHLKRAVLKGGRWRGPFAKASSSATRWSKVLGTREGSKGRVPNPGLFSTAQCGSPCDQVERRDCHGYGVVGMVQIDSTCHHAGFRSIDMPFLGAIIWVAIISYLLLSGCRNKQFQHQARRGQRRCRLCPRARNAKSNREPCRHRPRVIGMPLEGIWC